MKIRVLVETETFFFEAAARRPPPHLPEPQDFVIMDQTRDVLVTVEGAAEVTQQGIITAIKFHRVYPTRKFGLADLVKPLP